MDRILQEVYPSSAEKQPCNDCNVIYSYLHDQIAIYQTGLMDQLSSHMSSE